MTDKKYKYIKYEKLSDAVRDWELGKQIFFMEGICGTYIDNSQNSFFSHVSYYRREEVKPFECYVCVNADHSYVEIITDLREGYKIIKMREVIEE